MRRRSSRKRGGRRRRRRVGPVYAPLPLTLPLDMYTLPSSPHTYTTPTKAPTPTPTPTPAPAPTPASAPAPHEYEYYSDWSEEDEEEEEASSGSDVLLDVSGSVDDLAHKSLLLLDQFWAGELKEPPPPSPWYASEAADGPALMADMDGGEDQDTAGWVWVFAQNEREKKEEEEEEERKMLELGDLEPPFANLLVDVFGVDRVLGAWPQVLARAVGAHGTQRSRLRAAFADEIHVLDEAAAEVFARGGPAPDWAMADSYACQTLQASSWVADLEAMGMQARSLAATDSIHTAMLEWTQHRLAVLIGQEAAASAARLDKMVLLRNHMRRAAWLVQMQTLEASVFAHVSAARTVLEQSIDAVLTSVHTVLSDLMKTQEDAIATLRANHESQLAELDTRDFSHDPGVGSAARDSLLEAQATDILALRASHTSARSSIIDTAIRNAVLPLVARVVVKQLPPLYSISYFSLLPPVNDYGLQEEDFLLEPDLGFGWEIFMRRQQQQYQRDERGGWKGEHLVLEAGYLSDDHFAHPDAEYCRAANATTDTT